MVDEFWISDGTAARILPDGCADIVIDLDSARAMVVGPMTRPLLVEAGPRYAGVRFNPGYARLFVKEPLSEFTDLRLPQRDLGILASRVCDAKSDGARRQVLADVFRSANEPDARVARAVDLLMRSGGRMPIAAICDDIGVSRQHLARLFAEHVGLSPKMFARVMRFRRVLRMAQQERFADVAQELGYFDQSHLIDEFREFAGTTPVPFFQSR